MCLPPPPPFKFLLVYKSERFLENLKAEFFLQDQSIRLCSFSAVVCTMQAKRKVAWA